MTLTSYIEKSISDLEQFQKWFASLPEHLQTNDLDLGDWDCQLEDWKDSQYDI